jgi:hypothetical protein
LASKPDLYILGLGVVVYKQGKRCAGYAIYIHPDFRGGLLAHLGKKANNKRLEKEKKRKEKKRKEKKAAELGGRGRSRKVVCVQVQARQGKAKQ